MPACSALRGCSLKPRSVSCASSFSRVVFYCTTTPFRRPCRCRAPRRAALLPAPPVGLPAGEGGAKRRMGAGPAPSPLPFSTPLPASPLLVGFLYAICMKRAVPKNTSGKRRRCNEKTHIVFAARAKFRGRRREGRVLPDRAVEADQGAAVLQSAARFVAGVSAPGGRGIPPSPLREEGGTAQP